MLNRRSLITGLVSFLAAPAIVRATSLDSVLRGVPLVLPLDVTVTDILAPNEVSIGNVISPERMRAALGIISDHGLAFIDDAHTQRILAYTERRWASRAGA